MFLQTVNKYTNLERARESQKAQYNLTIQERQIRIYKLNNCKDKSEGN